MSTDPTPHPQRRQLRGFLISLAAFGTVFLLRLLFQPILGETVRFLPFILLSMAISFYFGFWPAIFVLALSVPTSVYFFVKPYYSFSVKEELDLYRLLVYVLVGLVSIVLNALIQRKHTREKTPE